MNDLIHKLISVLKEHVNQNNKEIQFNQKEIDNLLSEISAATRKKDLDIKYSLNRQLLNENSDFVKMQLELTDFFEKYRHLFPDVSEGRVSVSSDENQLKSVFQKTISGSLEFNPSHPQFNNPAFFRELLNYYESKEDYEMCESLLKMRKA
ncbi:MAG: hypothetical protein H6538_06165 [Bacteroidales bacterium]|nr:hypothetical protein [Bacteroidales bacterium]MCB9013811.1 hypothetical protein [Bacteroidales bacterium]